VLPSTTSATSSADVAQIVMEQLQILSLAEDDMPLRKYEVRQKIGKRCKRALRLEVAEIEHRIKLPCLRFGPGFVLVAVC